MSALHCDGGERNNVKSNVKNHLTLPQTSNFRLSSQVKEFAVDNNKTDENNRKTSRWVRNTEEKGEIAHYEQFLLFPQCFQKTCPADR